jgi:hypothetical protein
MGRRALTAEEKKARKQERNRKYFSNPDALARKRETDRARKRERRRQDQPIQHDPLALLADIATQRETLKHIDAQEIGSDVSHPPEPAPTGMATQREILQHIDAQETGSAISHPLQAEPTDTATQREILQHIDAQETGSDVSHPPEHEPTEEYDQGFEQEDGPIVDGGFSDNDWNEDWEEPGMMSCRRC